VVRIERANDIAAGGTDMRQIAATVAAGLSATGLAQAQAWPERPVKFVVAQPVGGTPDIIARLIADEAWGNGGAGDRPSARMSAAR
jgi:tripartite-type tricarboxylate transporter receptor subunit TctC